ncbi:MAG: ABC-type transport auxiliary lipoprotein family protein [Halioglobus sp.]
MKYTSLLFVVILAGCAGQVTEPSYYLLRSSEATQSGKLATSKEFSLGTVEIAAYLDQPGLVMETTQGQMRPANQNLWAEPIYDGVRNYLATEIAGAYGQELLPVALAQHTTEVDIRIDQLHGTNDGRAQLVAYWSLVRNNEVLSLNRFADTRALQASGYAALVDAEKALLADLAKQIAASLAAATP